MENQTELKLLQEGDTIYQIYRGKPYMKSKILRVTPKRAYSAGGEFEREYDRQIYKRNVDEYGMYTYHIETPELQYEWETIGIIAALNKISFYTVAPEKLREIKAILDRS